MSAPALLCLAALLDALLGEPGWLWSRLPHPAVLMGRLIGALDTRFNTGSRLRLKGVLAMVFVTALGLGIGWILSLGGPVVECLGAAILLAQKSLVQHVAAVAAGLRQSLQEGRDAVALIVSRDTSQMDETRTARAAIESAAENLSDGVIAPAFWFCIGGLPGMLVYKIVNTADSMIGYRTPRHEHFGWAAARFDDLLNLVPARLTALLIALPARQFGWRAIRADARLHRSPNAGWPEAAMARALGVALSGPRAYHGQMRDFPWVNADARRRLAPEDIDAAITMLWKAWALGLAFALLAAYLE